MGEELDYTTLKWVKDEIQESLNQTSQALETYVENPGDAAQLRFCATYLHQVYGTLQMVEIYGGALLAEEMEKVANALLNAEIGRKDDAIEVLMRAILQLPSYLEGLEHGQRDMPMVLLPLLNDLRAARGEKLLSESAFFAPDLDVAPPAPPSGKQYPEIQAYARKLRPIFQMALLGWYREQDTAGSLKKLAAVLRELQNAAQSETVRRLWWVAGGVVEALLDGGLETGTSLKLLLGNVDREIKRLIDEGESALDQAPSLELLKNCLYYVGSARSEGPRVSGLKQAFDLDRLMPYGGDLEEAMDNLKGSSSDLLESVAVVLKEDLLAIKDRLDLFARDSTREVAELAPLGESLRRIADTLAMLGLGDLRRVIQQQSEQIDAIVADTGEMPDDARLMEMASALLYVESSLQNLVTGPGSHDESAAPDLRGGEVTSPVLMPAGEQAQIVKLVIDESRQLLTDVKEGLNTFAAESASFEAIEEVPAKLAQIRGALVVLGMERASALMEVAIKYVRDDVLANRQMPTPGALDALADIITSIEYFLEAVEEGRPQPDTILTVAELSVEELGYPLIPTAVAEEATAEAGPLSDFDAQFAMDEAEILAPEPAAAAVAQAIDLEPAAAPLTELTVDIVAEEAAQEESAEPAVEVPPVETASEAVEPEIGAAASAPAEAETPPAPAAETAEDEFEADIEADIDEEILEIFLEEADEVIGTMTDCLHRWRADEEDHKSLETLRRSYHTLKGSGRLAGAVVTGEFAWAFESMLNRVLEGKITPSPAMFQLLSRAEDTLHGLLAHLKGESDRRPPVKALMALAHSLAEGVEIDPASIPGAAAPAVAAEPEGEAIAVAESEAEGPTIDAEPARDITAELPPAAAEVTEIPAEGLPEAVESVAETTEAPAEAAAPVFDPMLAEVFRKETESHLAAIRDYFTEHSAVGPFPVSEGLHRALHTLHGSARMADVESIAELSEPMDRLVRAMLEHDIPFDHEGLHTLEAFVQHVEELLAGFDQAVPPTLDTALLAQIEALRDAVATVPSKPASIGETAAANELALEDEELLAVFLEEAEEILTNTDALMQRWPAALHDLELVHELQRALHTLKGSARLAGIQAIGDLTHAVESLLEGVTEGRQNADTRLPSLVQEALDWVQQAIEQVRRGQAPAAAEECLAHLAQWLPAAQEQEQAPADETPAEPLEVSHDVVTAPDLGEAPADEATIAEPVGEAPEAATGAVEEAAEEEEIELAPMSMAQPGATAAAPAASAEYDTDLLEVFLEEADELQETAEKILHRWAGAADDASGVPELQRTLHTLKGGARMAGVSAIGDLAHAMESLLERIGDGQIAPQSHFPGLLQRCHDWLGNALEEVRQLRAVAPASALLAELEAALRGGQVPASVQAPSAVEEPSAAVKKPSAVVEKPSASEAPAASKAPAEAEEELEELAPLTTAVEPAASEAAALVAEEQVRVRADLLNDLANYSGEINIYNARIAQQLSAWRFNLAELEQTVSRLREQLRKFEIETEAQIMYRYDTGTDNAAAEDFDPLELDRFSTMQQLSRGMSESLGDLTSIENLLEELSSEADTLLLQQQRVTGELQEGLMHTRMVAFASILPRLRRIIRQTATETSKQVELVVNGAEGELDRTQLNRLVPALEHILRNAVDHGIEAPAAREQAAKPAVGTVTIELEHQGSEVVLSISDDGAGLDIAALREKAIEKGRLLPDADLSDRELITFILESGFSTAKEVTQISGRGVGMDVVNTEIKQLGGILHIDTEQGRGSRFVIRLPLTVLVNQALMVQVGEATYAIQLPNVEHVIRISREELEPLVTGAESDFDYAGNHYRYLSLGQTLSGVAPSLPPAGQRIPLLLLRSGDHRVALQVDHLQGRQEIVIKSVGPQLSGVSVLSGATILPDGEVALILDVGNLVRSVMAQRHIAVSEPLLGAAAAVPAAEEAPLTVMVVDDSITVRKVTERLLKRYDFEVITAKDGVDALTVMLEQVPDVMLLDVEMPRMDGYELATTMRNDPRLKAVPIIMITSRTGDKHRQRAMDIGVNQYMGKPYQEQELIENIRSLVGVAA